MLLPALPALLHCIYGTNQLIQAVSVSLMIYYLMQQRGQQGMQQTKSEGRKPTVGSPLPAS